MRQIEGEGRHECIPLTGSGKRRLFFFSLFSIFSSFEEKQVGLNLTRVL
jgi:hypothetical protein